MNTEIDITPMVFGTPDVCQERTNHKGFNSDISTHQHHVLNLVKRYAKEYLGRSESFLNKYLATVIYAAWGFELMRVMQVEQIGISEGTFRRWAGKQFGESNGTQFKEFDARLIEQYLEIAKSKVFRFDPSHLKFRKACGIPVSQSDWDDARNLTNQIKDLRKRGYKLWSHTDLVMLRLRPEDVATPAQAVVVPRLPDAPKETVQGNGAAVIEKDSSERVVTDVHSVMEGTTDLIEPTVKAVESSPVVPTQTTSVEDKIFSAAINDLVKMLNRAADSFRWAKKKRPVSEWGDDALAEVRKAATPVTEMIQQLSEV